MSQFTASSQCAEVGSKAKDKQYTYSLLSSLSPFVPTVPVFECEELVTTYVSDQMTKLYFTEIIKNMTCPELLKDSKWKLRITSAQEKMCPTIGNATAKILTLS